MEQWGSYGEDSPSNSDYEGFEENVERLRDMYSGQDSEIRSDGGRQIAMEQRDVDAYFAQFAEEYGQETADTVEAILGDDGGWTESPYNNDTAPLWQLAARDGGRQAVPQEELLATYVDEQEIEAVEQFIDYTQQVLQDEEEQPVVEVYRGIKPGRRLDTITASSTVGASGRTGGGYALGDQLMVPHKLLESWTPDREYAEQLAPGGVVLKREVPIHRIVGSLHTSPSLYKENEVIVRHDRDDTYTIGKDAFPQQDDLR